MEIKLLNHAAQDIDVVNAARVSFADQVDTMGERDQGLINFLVRNRHGSPFEHGYFRWHVEAPIFVFREWHRHRVGHSYNEQSGRYVELKERFYSPKKARMQVGKPGAYTYEEFDDPAGISHMKDAFQYSWKKYQDLLNHGWAKEQARAVLPLGIYSQMYWSCNPRSLMHFMSLRNAPDAQQEIRDLASQAEEAFTEIMPWTAKAFIDNNRQSP